MAMKRIRSCSAFVLLLLLLVNDAAHAGNKLVWSSMLVTTGTLDLLSTEAAIKRGAHEASPIPRWAGSRGRVVLHTAGGAMIVGAASWVKKRGHKKTAWALVIALAVAQSYAAIRNHRVQR